MSRDRRIFSNTISIKSNCFTLNIKEPTTLVVLCNNIPNFLHFIIFSLYHMDGTCHNDNDCVTIVFPDVIFLTQYLDIKPRFKTASFFNPCVSKSMYIKNVVFVRSKNQIFATYVLLRVCIFSPNVVFEVKFILSCLFLFRISTTASQYSAN